MVGPGQLNVHVYRSTYQGLRLTVAWHDHRYALGAWDMFKACAHRELILMKRHSFTYKTRCARRAVRMPELGQTDTSNL